MDGCQVNGCVNGEMIDKVKDSWMDVVTMDRLQRGIMDGEMDDYDRTEERRVNKER